MKKHQLKELKKSSKEDLQKKADNLRAEIAQNSVKITAGRESNLKLIKNLRQDLAQILTLINANKKDK